MVEPVKRHCDAVGGIRDQQGEYCCELSSQADRIPARPGVDGSDRVGSQGQTRVEKAIGSRWTAKQMRPSQRRSAMRRAPSSKRQDVREVVEPQLGGLRCSRHLPRCASASLTAVVNVDRPTTACTTRVPPSARGVGAHLHLLGPAVLCDVGTLHEMRQGR
jgi:hypothetical protein